MKTRSEFVTNFLRISLGAGLILAAGCSRLLNSDANAGKSEAFISNAGIRDVVARVAKHQIRPLANGDYPEVKSVEEAKAARPPEGISWSYPWGVALYGLIRSTDATGDRAADKFAVEHDQICARYYQWLAGLKKT
jgi:hypothetical protein